jgi:hypothetical protein
MHARTAGGLLFLAGDRKLSLVSITHDTCGCGFSLLCVLISCCDGGYLQALVQELRAPMPFPEAPFATQLQALRWYALDMFCGVW